MMEVGIVEMTFVTLDPTPIACLQIVGPYANMAEAFPKLMEWAGPRGLLGPTTRILGRYPDDPATTPEDERRSEACMTVPPGTDGDADVTIAEIGGDYAMALHVGTYETLGDTYGALMQFVAESGRPFRDAPPMEIYLDGPETPPEETRTEVYMAVE